MTTMIARRLLQLPIILLIIYTLTLSLAWAVPGNPLEKGEGRRPPEEVVEAMSRQYNLDRFDRFFTSYLYNATGVRWLWESVLTDRAGQARERAIEAGQSPPPRFVFDFGPSLQYEDWRVNEIVADALPVSVTLGAIAILIALVVGVFAGVVGAVRPNSFADLATLTVALVGISLPSFVIGTVLVVVFGVWLRLFPIGGWGTPAQMVLPAVTLSLPFAAYIARLTRMGMIEHLKADFIRTARAKGLPESRVLLKHALKNAFLPVLSYLGPAAALAMTGSFVVERVFTIPGMGQHFVNAVLNKDLFLIMGVVLIFATMLIVFNLLVDVLYRWVDPRID
ncbi:MAG: ABC transporter permease [Phycisphaeraceae bacterium]|nr:ABC transporter permease [Phycisphaeraceae bacterium]